MAGTGLCGTQAKVALYTSDRVVSLSSGNVSNGDSLGCAKAHFVRQPWDIVALRRLVQSLLFFIIFVVPPIGSATNSNVLDVIVYFSGTGECAVGSGEREVKRGVWGVGSVKWEVGTVRCEV